MPAAAAEPAEAAPEPVAAPGAAEPTTPEPVAAEPTTPEPVAAEPTTLEPEADERETKHEAAEAAPEPGLPEEPTIPDPVLQARAQPEAFASEVAKSHAIEQRRMSIDELLTSDEEHADAPTRNAHHRAVYEATDEAVEVRVYNEEEGLDITFPCEPGEFILDAAERAGYDLPFSCRSGGCLTCSAKTIEGTWEMDEQYVLEDEHIEEGFMLLCCTAVTSPGVFLSHQQDEVE